MNKPPQPAWVDSNLILRFLIKDHQAFYKAAYKLFSEAENGRLMLYINPLTIAEVVWTLESFYRYPKKEISSVLSSLIESEGLCIPEKEVVKKALNDYTKNNVDYVDAYLAAYAALKGPSAIYTLDKKHFSKLDGDIIFPD